MNNSESKNNSLSKDYFSFWTINEYKYLLRNISFKYFVFFVIPIFGFILFLSFFISKFTRINRYIFTSKSYKWKLFWKKLYNAFLIPIHLSIFLFIFIVPLADYLYGNQIAIYTLVVVSSLSFLSFWVSHIVFAISNTKIFNLYNRSINNFYFYSYKNESLKSNYYDALEIEKNNLINDYENKKEFLKRFTKNYYEKDDAEFNNIYDKEKWNWNYITDNSNQDILRKYFDRVVEEFKNAESSTPFDKYKKEFAATKEFESSFYIFDSILGTNILMEKESVFSFKKYFSLLLYFCFLEIWIFSPVILNTYVYSLHPNKTGEELLMSLGNLGWLVIMYIVMGLTWRTNIKVFLKEVEFLTLKSAIDEFYILYNLDMKLHISNPLIYLDKNFKIQYEDFLNDVSKFEEDKNYIVNEIESILNNKTKIYKKMNKLQYIISCFHFFNFVFQVLYILFLGGWLYIKIEINKNHDISYILLICSLIYAFIFLVYFSIVVFIACSVKSQNKQISQINTLFNQKLLNFYITSHYQIPSVYIINPKFSRGSFVESGLGDYDKYFTINFFNSEYKRCTDEFNQESFDIFINELEKYKGVCEKGKEDFFGLDSHFIYDRKLDIRYRLFDWKKEYIE